MPRSTILVFLLAVASFAQSPLHLTPSTTPQTTNPTPADPDPETLSADEITRRDALMRPALTLLKKGDSEAAYKALWPARKAFPKDLRVLRYSAESAFYSNHNPEALDLFTRALAEHPTHPWPLHLARLQVLARLGKWEEFDQDLDLLRTAKKSSTDHQLDDSTGFLIDTFRAGPEPDATPVQAIVFPLQSDAYHTLFRFMLPKSSPAKTPIQAGVNSDDGQNDERCKNPDFRPYIDLESDDVDQATFKQAHPDLAEKGDRAYSLDTYSGPCSQGLIKFYNSGEPLYQLVRADVLKALTSAPNTEVPAAEKPTSSAPSITPETKPAPDAQPQPEARPEQPAKPEPAPDVKPDPVPPAEPELRPETRAKPERAPESKPEPKPEPAPEPAPTEPRPQSF